MKCTEDDAVITKDAQPKQIANAGTGVWLIPLAPLAGASFDSGSLLMVPVRVLPGTLTQVFFKSHSKASSGVATPEEACVTLHIPYMND